MLSLRSGAMRLEEKVALEVRLTSSAAPRASRRAGGLVMLLTRTACQIGRRIEFICCAKSQSALEHHVR